MIKKVISIHAVLVLVLVFRRKPKPFTILILQEALICGQGLNDQDIQMLLALSEAMTCTDGLVPPEAVRLFKKVEFVKE